MNISFAPHFFVALLFATACAAEEKPAAPPSSLPVAEAHTPSNASPFALADQVSLDTQSITIDGRTLNYAVRAGALTVRGKEENDTANISYIAYFATDPDLNNDAPRPIAFCFNGGPGSSSVWLHMGFLGPKTVDLQNTKHPELPVGYKDNPHSLLCVSDLVFIDPVSTGFSTVANKGSPKKFHGVEEDLFSLADFIRLFLTKYQRWQSPKLLIGESYGTLRAVGLAHLLQDHYFIDINGLVLISLVLDLQTLESSPSMDIPCMTLLPTLASIARYHQQLSPPFSELPVQTILENAARFAVEEYGPALFEGSNLSADRKHHIAQRLSDLTSLPVPTISSMDLRISYDRFCREFLQSTNQTVGRYDARMTSYRVPEEPSACGEISSPDPSFYAISGAFSSAFQTYLLKDLKWKRAEPYVVISDAVHPWNWTVDARPSAGCGYLSMLQDLRMAMTKNPSLKLFVAGGYYDLATPYFSQEYSLSHLLLPPELQKNITLKGYEAGHMMYLDEPSRAALYKDLLDFVAGVKREE